MARQLDSFSLQLAAQSANLNAIVSGSPADVAYNLADFQNWLGLGSPAVDLVTGLHQFCVGLFASLAADKAELDGAVTALKNWSGASSTTIGANLTNLMGNISNVLGSVAQLASVATAVHAKVGAIPDTGDSAAALAAFVPHCTVT
jgi:hypothetical protein